MNHQERSGALSSYDTNFQVSIDKQEVVGESGEEDERRKNKEREEDNDSTPSKVLSKLVDIAVGAHNLGYDLVAGPQGRVWDDLNLSQDFMLLTREMVNVPSGSVSCLPSALIAFQSPTLTSFLRPDEGIDVVQREIETKLRMALLPPIFFLQRDRMLSRPESIPETLALGLSILRIRDETEESQEKDKTSRDLREQVAVSILAALSASVLTPSQNQSMLVSVCSSLL
jgi:hypothetical protein